MSITMILVAFACGVMACSMGGLQTFVFAGFTGMVGMGISAAMNTAVANPELAALLFPTVANGDISTAVLGNLGWMIGDVSFGPMFSPAIALVGTIWAGAYARRRNYITGAELADAQSWVPLFDPIKKVDVLLVGGLGGVFGLMGSYLIDVVLGIGIDSMASVLIISSIMCKLWLDHKLITPVPKELEVNGNRFNPNQQSGWLGYLNKASIRFTLAICVGAVFGYAVRLGMLNYITFSFAHTIGFLIGGAALMFLFMGYKIVPLMPMSVPACFGIKGMIITLGNTPAAAASVPALDFMIWGAGFAVLGVFASYAGMQLLSAFSDNYIDAPAIAITTGSFTALTIIPAFPQLANNVILPVSFIIIGLLYSVAEYFICKETSAYNNLNVNKVY